MDFPGVVASTSGQATSFPTTQENWESFFWKKKNLTKEIRIQADGLIKGQELGTA